MWRYLVILVVSIFSCNYSYSQIIAGQTEGPGIHYFPCNTIVTMSVVGVNTIAVHHEYDVDEDGVMDIRFVTNPLNPPNYFIFNMFSLNSVRCATMGFYVADTLKKDTLINKSLKWNTEDQNKIGASLVAGSYYVGFRKTTLADTIYGWFLVDVPYKIISYAYTKSDGRELAIYPNPCKNTFRITGNYKIRSCVAYDILGKPTVLHPLSYFEVGVQDLSVGVYYVVIETIDDQTHKRKLVVVNK